MSYVQTKVMVKIAKRLLQNLSIIMKMLKKFL